MSNNTSYFSRQYQWIRESRQVMLDYCGQLTPEHLICENPSFGRGGSIRNLLVHIVNTYEFWVGKQALKKEIVFTEMQSIKTIAAVAESLTGVDNMMVEFISRLEDSVISTIEYEINGNAGAATPLKIFSHVITHEFHHKGQILSLSRHLGYIPVDTDILR